MRAHVFAGLLLRSLGSALLCWGLLGCPSGGGEAPSLIEQAAEREKQHSRRSSGGAAAGAGLDGAVDQGSQPAPGRYVKREGLHIDVPYLAGRRLAELTPLVIADQLGAEVAREELPMSEEKRSFEKAELWLYDGRIYRVRKVLGHSMDIPTALGTSGFPLDLGRAIEATNEVRWNRVWNMRRVSLIRNEGDERLYDIIDVYRFLPRELR